jgi:hypothetical protein
VGGSKYNAYCSTVCREIAGYGVPKTRIDWCEGCGRLYKPIRSKRGHFCTHECYAKSKVSRGLPSHKTFIPFRFCTECGRIIAGPRKRLTCSADCGYARNVRAISEAIKKRYREDSEFRDHVLSAGQNRRARDLGLDQITTPKTLIAFLVARDQGVCGICEEPVVDTKGPMKPSIDHVIPLARGGKHEIENLQLAHYRCNLSKGARIPP